MHFNTSFLKAGVIAMAIAAGTTVAHADTLTGSFNINSGDQITVTMSPTSAPTTITFDRNGTPISPNDGTLVSNVGTIANRTGILGSMLYFGQNVSFLNPIQITPGSAGETIFDTGSYLGNDLTFVAFSSFVSGINTTNGIPNAYTFQGFLYNNGASQTPGTFTITDVTDPTTSSITFTSVASAAATPEPNSLMLLGTGFVSAAGMLMRRRKLMAA